ncbi:MAG TPA: choice-of-anchor tandem repeat GloVer-containing protein [Rhizomicrobium sp.]|jgi:uncharacterized repeat protein (TIGR03803 family)
MKLQGALFFSSALASIFFVHAAAGWAATEKVLACFNGIDGETPKSAPTALGKNLYGTTYSGGSGEAGVVYTVDLRNDLLGIVYKFSGPDGQSPGGRLTASDGILYGTTQAGGGGNCDSGCGTVFALDPKSGAETVLHAFRSNSRDGLFPSAGMMEAGGTLYGTTQYGGRGNCSGLPGCGTVFSVDPANGDETVLHSFENDGKDGLYPVAGLIRVNGTLYGTTQNGGTGSCDGVAPGCGTVFAIDLKTGTETVLYSFGSRSRDGLYPEGGLIAMNGTLYGTTLTGGTADSGTVYAFDSNTGKETVLHSFCRKEQCVDGSFPAGDLVAANGELYGTTEYGGMGLCTDGCGAVFAIEASTGAAKVLYSFAGNGVYPEGGLADANGALLGTTSQGGCENKGTVFSIKP